MITVKEVKNKKEMKKFVNFVSELYRGCKQYVPPFYDDEMNLIDPKKNPSLAVVKAKFFLAYRDDKIVGRIVGIIHPEYNEKSGKKYIRFSRFDAIDDEEVANALFNAVFEFGKQEGMEFVHGPLGFDDFDREGLVVEGFEYRTTISNAYNYDYYMKHIERLGFTKEIDWLEYRITVPKERDEKIAEVAELVAKKYELTDVSEIYKTSVLVKKYGMEIFRLLNDTYKHLHGFVHISDEQAKIIINTYFKALDIKYLSVIVDKNGKLIAFGTALACISNALQKCDGKILPVGFIRLLYELKHPKDIELALVCIADEYKNKAVNAIMINKIMTNAIKSKIRYAETNSELETNTKVQAMWKNFDKIQHRRRRCFVKPL